MAGGQWNGTGSVASSLAPIWRSSEEGATAPTWTCPVYWASSVSRLGPQDQASPPTSLVLAVPTAVSPTGNKGMHSSSSAQVLNLEEAKERGGVWESRVAHMQ